MKHPTDIRPILVEDGWAGASNPNPHHKSPSHMHNRSPKGNMWSAIPVALLCMVVNWNERQGSGPKRDEVL